MLRLTAVCDVHLRDAGVVDRVLSGDETVCGKKNPVLRKLRDLLKINARLRGQSGGPHRAGVTKQIVRRIIERPISGARSRRKLEGSAPGVQKKKIEERHHLMKKASSSASRSSSSRTRVARQDFRSRTSIPGDTAHLKSGEQGEAKEMLARGWNGSPSSKTCSMPRITGPCCSSYQAMDAAGKEATIQHVTAGINPQGCQVTFVQAAVERGASSRFLWRYMRNVPARGQIGISTARIRGAARREGA